MQRLTLTEEQTNHLTELGLPKPKTFARTHYVWQTEEYIDYYIYSIGELLHILPNVIKHNRATKRLTIIANYETYTVMYAYVSPSYQVTNDGLKMFEEKELTDALYKMILYLKDKNII